MRFSPRAAALLLLLSLLPAVAMVAHWSWLDSTNADSSRTQSSAETKRADAATELPGACQPERPCADASVHGFSALSWVDNLFGGSRLSYLLSRSSLRWPGGLASQSGVTPDPFPPRVAVS